MQVVDAVTGSLVGGHDSFAVGCSHSWDTRIGWDPRTGHFVMTCATDNGCRIAQPAPYRTVATATCDGTLFGGDLLPSATEGHRGAWSRGGQVPPTARDHADVGGRTPRTPAMNRSRPRAKYSDSLGAAVIGSAQSSTFG